MDYTAEFETFWKAFPKRWNRSSGRHYKVGKYEASQVWKRLSQKDRNKILIVVKYMQTGEFVLDAHRWLKKRRFDDIEIREPLKRKPVVSREIKKIETPEEIKAKEERYKKGQIWKTKYDKRKKKLFEMPDMNLVVSTSDKVNTQRKLLSKRE